MGSRLSGIEAIMWKIGDEPGLRMTVGSLLILDRPVGRAALADRLAQAAARAPRLRRWPQEPGPGVRRPGWVVDRELNPTDHLRTLAVAPGAAGTARAALDIVALIEATPFAHRRPPWDVTIIEGLQDGRSAVYLRAHHVVTDGLGGMALTRLLLDDPGAPETGSPAATAAAGRAAPRAWRRAPRIFPAGMLGAAPTLAARTSAMMLDHPFDTARRGAQLGFDVATSMARQVGPGRRLAPLPFSSTVVSRFEILSAPGARGAARALGGSRNDLLIAATAAGLGLYHQRLGAPCAELRLATSSRRRRDPGAGGNSFAPVRVDVPTGLGHPGPRFDAVVERLARARSEPVLRLSAPLANAVGNLPVCMIAPAVHAQVGSIDFLSTALPGMRRPGKLCGAAVEASYPFGPRLGCPVNVTGFGNEDRLDIGVSLDPGAITETELLLDCLDRALRTFVRAGDERLPRGTLRSVAGLAPGQ